jgi:FixJ family two-component response regulator
MAMTRSPFVSCNGCGARAGGACDRYPGRLGYFLKDKSKFRSSCKPIIFMSALPAEQVPFRAKAAGAFGFMRKPFSGERLIECLDKALKGEDARSAGCS